MPPARLKERPLLATSKTPNDIWADVLGTSPARLHADVDYTTLKTVLAKYYRSGRSNWDEFISAQRLPLELRDLLKRVRIELKRHGFTIYGAGGDELIHCYLTDTAKRHRETAHRAPPVTHCDLCERDCTRKDMRGVHRKGMARCWEGRVGA